jgi:hypothetical protein
MIYASLLICLMIASTTLRILAIYLGLPEMDSITSFVNWLIMVTVLVKFSAVTLIFITGEIKHERQRKASFSN